MNGMQGWSCHSLFDYVNLALRVRRPGVQGPVTCGSRAYACVRGPIHTVCEHVLYVVNVVGNNSCGEVVAHALQGLKD